MDKIELVVFDIDGVIADGSVIIDSKGNEQKKMNWKDVDALFELHSRGFKIAAITGEDTEIVDYFEKRFPWERFYRGSKTKKHTLEQIEEGTNISREHICYVGDGKYDIEPLFYAGLGACPSNAIDKAKRAADIILQNKGGDGCIWELISVLENYNAGNTPYNFIYQRLEDHNSIFKSMATDQKLMADVMEAGDKLVEIFQNGGGLYVFGNGRSAVNAQYLATEFVSRFYQEGSNLNAEALTVNTSVLAAVGNGFDFERDFSRQLEVKAKPGDALISISNNGLGRDIIEALRYAKRNRITSVWLTGAHDAPIDSIGNYVIKVQSMRPSRIQEAHMFIGHVLAEYVEWKMFGHFG